MSGIHSARGQISEGWSMFQHSWQKANSKWNDALSRSFEEQYIQAIQSAIPPALKEIERLASVIQKAQQEVP